MTLVIDLSAEEEAKLKERAAARGQDLSDYARSMLLLESAAQSLDEFLAPLRKEFAESGMTEEELDALIEEAREEVWQERLGHVAK
jgi:DNA repair exonuclease SbcCD ATPase subunit